ncbi:propionaldehyde dehydrogenase [Natronincola peptidivorans]|uniref:Propionaldehyde dehydrogenase n=1 Tax=Natronincola peptidivorans TaxID=426128 RepID=A0A1I0CFI3_9FIRM|nr:aldehyde dehydrogenase family protein [Natronincola peptidivorans]SET18357.1 propionaldehyde dehydrogenase [Natronincola peptidivorans]
MAVADREIQEIVKEVLKKLQSTSEIPIQKELGIFEDMEDAIRAAKYTQEQLREMSLEFREKIISNIRKKTLENSQLLAEMGVQETGMGRVGHKVLKHQLVAEKTPGTEDLTTGVWSGDRGLTLVEQGPFGVIGAVTPSTNPSETVICNTIGMIAGGNTVVFNPHPGAIQVSNQAVKLLNEASMEVGGPANIATSVTKPTLKTADVLFHHIDIPLLVATGGPAVVQAVLSSGKRGIGAGAGNPPVVVDETADIKKAAEDIVNGATFDNNLPCIAEKEVIAVNKITDELLYYMQENGCYKASWQEVGKLANLLLDTSKGHPMVRREWVGKDAKLILRGIGVEVEEDIRCIIFESPRDHIFVVEELMMPVLGIIRAEDFQEAMDIAKELEHGNRHSAHIHSKNVDNLTRFGKAIDTAIFVKNAPSYAALGFGGEGYCSFTIASKTGEGLTSTKTFTKSRRCVLSDNLSIR